MVNHIAFPKLGLEFEISRVAFNIFGLRIYWYGIIITVGLMLSVLVALKLAKKYNIDEDKLLDVIMVSGVLAIVCARIYYVIFAPFEYDSLWDMINIRDGGIAIYGAVLGAFSTGFVMCKIKKLDFLKVADIAAVCFLLGQGIGRWGNFVNQEAFGTNTDSVFGMISENTTKYLQRVAPSLAQQGITVDPYAPVHPTFLYESLWCLLGFALIMWYISRKKFDGEILCLYMIWYGTGRFFIEGLRTDSLTTNGGMRTSQIVAVVSVMVGIAVILYNLWRRKQHEKGRR